MPISPQELTARLSRVPRIAGDLMKLVQAPHFHGVIDPAEAAALAASAGVTVDQLALELVGVAGLHAVTPVSGYKVGAVGVGLSGALYFGANLEVAGEALSVTVHAEQAAVANAWVNGERGLGTLAISAAPCGYCRQFLYELVDAAKLVVKLPTRSQPLTHFLPDAFGPGNLGKTGGLMQAQSNGLTVSQALNDTGVAALGAANASYSPYTQTFAGVALKTHGGAICTGRYAENAAYNASMSPLQAALSQLVFHDQPFSGIVEAVLVEAPGRASQVGATEALLARVCTAPLTVYKASVS